MFDIQPVELNGSVIHKDCTYYTKIGQICDKCGKKVPSYTDLFRKIEELEIENSKLKWDLNSYKREYFGEDYIETNPKLIPTEFKGSYEGSYEQNE